MARAHTHSVQSFDTSISKKSSLSSHSATLARDPNWKKIQQLTPEEERELEQRWDRRHHRHYQEMNEILNPAYRDYFDRQRELLGEFTGVRPKHRWLSTWSLAHTPGEDD